MRFLFRGRPVAYSGAGTLQWNAHARDVPTRCLTLALAVAVSAGACARPPSNEHERNPAMPGATQTGRTINGHTYTDAPVDVKLGPNTFRIPANYLTARSHRGRARA